MKTNRRDTLDSCRAAIESRLIDGRLVDEAQARLLGLLADGEGVIWQEVIDAPIDAVWSAIDDTARGFCGHLPDVIDVRPLSGDPSFHRIVRDIVGRREERIGEVLVKMPGTMICASDLDARHPASIETLPTLYSLEMHEHPTRADATVVVLAAVTLGLYNPWLLAALGHVCSSVRTTLERRAMHPRTSTQRAAEILPLRPAIAGAAAR